MATTQLRGSTQIKANTVTSGQVDSSIIIAGGGNPFTGNQGMGGFLLQNVGAPSAGTDAATKAYVDTAIQGLSQKPTARLATAAALPAGTYSNGTSGVGATFSVTATGTLTVDGVLTALNDLILVKNQASALQNGLYQVTVAGAGGVAAVLTRHVDMDTALEFDGGFCPVDNEGTANANTLWLVNNLGAVTVGTTAVTFTQLAAPTSYTGGNGVTLTSTSFSADLGNGLQFSGTHITLKPDSTTGGNTANVIVTASNGVGVAIDNATIAVNGSTQLYVPTGGIGTTQLAAASVTAAKLAAQASGTGLQGGAGSNLSVKFSNREVPTGSINGSNTSFTLANTPVSGLEMVFLNGILQNAGAGKDYTISTLTITMLSAPVSADVLLVSYFY